MSLVPSLLQAIVSLDGEACVIHVGEKPYVVAPTGQVDLATRGLTFEAVNGILEQLLPIETQNALDEFGAIQYELPPRPDLPNEHFTVVVARGGDDVWVEIRRRRTPDAQGERAGGDAMDLRGAVDSLPEPTALPQPADQGDLLKPDDTAHPEGRHAGVFRGPAQHGALVDLKHARNVLGREVHAPLGLGLHPVTRRGHRASPRGRQPSCRRRSALSSLMV